jgi:hypothetical protein
VSNRNRYRAEQRRRLAGRATRAMVSVGLLCVTAFYAYNVGAQVVRDDMAEMSDKLQTQLREDGRTRDELTATKAALAEARRDAETYRGLYQASQPNGDAAQVVRLVQDKLATGVPRDRLTFFIQAAEGPMKCSDLAARPLKVVTGGKGGEELKFGDTRSPLVVSATGTALPPTKNGKPQRLFDPAKPVTVRFTPTGARASEATGPLPLTHTVLTRNYEQRFTITAGTNGSLQVAGTRCEFGPG